MIAVDTNILVYAHSERSPWHRPARVCLETLSAGSEAWAVPWPCIHEFLAVVTNPRVLRPPTTVEMALRQVEALLGAPEVVTLRETDAHWSVLSDLLRSAGATGGLVHDARIAALCREHGVHELWTADRDFARFPGIVTFNPIEADAVHDASPSWAAAQRARIAGRRRAVLRDRPRL